MNAKILFQQALLSEAAYANFWDEDRQEVITIDSRVKTALKAAGFSPSQADYFVNHWQIVSHQPNTGSLLNPIGFSGTLFKSTDPDAAQSYIFALRGTEPGIPDLLVADGAAA